MAKDYYAEIYLHLTWHVAPASARIGRAFEPKLWDYIQAKCAELDVEAIEIGGTADHVHLLVAMPPHLSVSHLVGKVKGSSSHYVNQQVRPRKKFGWQHGYACLSFAKRDLAALRQYVQRQKAHHAEGRARALLERFGPKGH